MRTTVPKCPSRREMMFKEETGRWHCGICGHIEIETSPEHPDGLDLCNCGFCIRRRPNHAIHVSYTKCGHCAAYILIDRDSPQYEAGIPLPLRQTCAVCGKSYEADEFAKGFVSREERDKGWTLTKPPKS